MKKYLMSFFVIWMAQSILSNLLGQTIINYQTWTGATGCNIFSSSTSVPAITNGNNITVAHQSNIGQPEYSGGSTNAVSLGCFAVIDANGNTTAYKGTEFRLVYNFQPGNSYEIKINAACINGNSANLRILPNSGGNGSSTQCNGPADIDPNTSGNLYSNRVMSGGTTWTDYTYNYGAFASAQTLLNISAVPPVGSGTQTILIRKITITETPPTPTFTLSPSPTLNVPLGTNSPQTFTVTNVYNSPGVTSYEWNLGSATNGWLYFGNPAPQNISTSTNTLMLTPDPCVSLSNISVTVRINNLNYQTLNCSVTRTIPSASSFAISGSNEFCTSANYTISGGSLCGANVTWSLGYLSNHPTVASLSCTSCPTTTLTKINNGTAWLISTFTFPGSSTPYTYEKYIGVGVPVIRGWYNSPTNPEQPLLASSRFEFNWNDACYATMISTNMDITANTTVTWEDAGNSGGVTWYQSGNNLNFYFSNLEQWAYFRVTATNSCGSQSWLYRFRSVGDNCSGGALLRLMISPNPTFGSMSVGLAEKQDEKKVKEIVEIRIIDKLGTLKQKWSYGKSGYTQLRQLNVSNLSPDIYTMMAFDGKTWTSEKFIKQ